MQTKTGSLTESALGATISGSTGGLLNWMLLDVFGNILTEPTLKAQFIIANIVVFYFHSMLWRYIIRRTFEKHNIDVIEKIRHVLKLKK